MAIVKIRIRQPREFHEMDIPIHVSHAKEDQVPGTVYLTAEEGDETHYGQALFPIPTADPNDPLNLPKWRKYCCLISVVLFTLVGNASILMPAPFIIPWTVEYGVTAQEASTVESYRFSCTRSSISSGFHSLSSLVDDLYGCCQSLSSLSCTVCR